jgi:hypothetical protein
VNRRARLVFCTIASKEVGISLRVGGGFREPDSMYVRCAERDCQYVDLNQPPCPLNPSMFDDGTERRLGLHLQAHAGSRSCFSCLMAALGATHEQLRRASSRLRNKSGVSIRPARCAVCRRRGVTIGLEGCATLAVVDGVRTLPPSETTQHAPLSVTAPLPASSLDETTAADDGTARVVAFIVEGRGDVFCPSCVALSVGLGLADTRRIVDAAIHDVPDLERLEATCSTCGRLQSVVRSRSATRDHVAGQSS